MMVSRRKHIYNLEEKQMVRRIRDINTHIYIMEKGVQMNYDQKKVDRLREEKKQLLIKLDGKYRGK